MADFWMKRGDLSPAYTGTIVDTDGDAVDLSGASKVEIRLRLATGTVIKREVTVTDAPNGRISYAWQSGDTDVVGPIDIDFPVTENAKVTTYPSVGFARVQISAGLEE